MSSKFKDAWRNARNKRAYYWQKNFCYKSIKSHYLDACCKNFSLM